MAEKETNILNPDSAYAKSIYYVYGIIITHAHSELRKKL